MLSSLGVPLPATTALLSYRSDLMRFNRARNLVSRRGGAGLVGDLVLESVLAARLLPADGPGPWLDLGSGAGIPGIPVALLHPERRVCLLERRTARCAFLRRELAALALRSAELLEGEAEGWAQEPGHAQAYAGVLLKAVADPPRALELARPFLVSSAWVALFQRGSWALDGVARRSWRERARYPLALPGVRVRDRELPALVLLESLDGRGS